MPMREDSEIPPLEGFLTVKNAAKLLGLSERMVHTYIQDGRLVAKRIGNIMAIAEDDFLKFQRAKKGRPRTRLPVWRKSVGDNLEYATDITARLKEGQSANFLARLDEFRSQGQHMIPGTVARYISRGGPDLSQVRIILIWRTTVMPEKAECEAAIRAMSADLAEMLDWGTLKITYEPIVLHT